MPALTHPRAMCPVPGRNSGQSPAHRAQYDSPRSAPRAPRDIFCDAVPVTMAAGTPLRDNERSLVDVYLTGGHGRCRGAAYIWSHEDAFRVRSEFRLLGDFCGTLPKHTAQNQYLSLPLVLSYDEVCFGFARGFFRILSDSPAEDYVLANEEDADAFDAERALDQERQAEESCAHQEEERARQMKKTDAVVVAKIKSRKRARDADDDADDVPRPVKRMRKIDDLGFFSRIAFRAHSFVHALLPVVAKAPVIDEYMHEAPALSDAEVVTPATENPLSEKRATEIAAQKAARKEEERRRVLRARQKQQALTTALVITATPARDSERRQRPSLVFDVPLPRGISAKRLQLRQAVFCDLYDKGYFMSCGAKFGADFLAYAGDPLLFHAALAIIVKEGDEEVSPHDIVALGRLGDSTKKRTVLAYVEGEAKGSHSVKYIGVQWEETLP